MLKRSLNKSQKGFTIIEVMIVLAIAGLILVMVLIAIPQLQRNQRNTARQNDASRLATSVSRWTANNSGTVPSSASEPNIVADIGRLSQYDIATDANMTIAAIPAVPVANTTLSLLEVKTGAACGTNGLPTPGTIRQFVILYATENSTGTGIGQCLSI